MVSYILFLTVGPDYTYVTVTVTFAPGQTVASVSVPITDDNTVESTEMFSATLTATQSNVVVIGEDTATVTILDGDGMSFSVCNCLFRMCKLCFHILLQGIVSKILVIEIAVC